MHLLRCSTFHSHVQICGQAELVRVACEMEGSMQKKLKRVASPSSRPQSAADRQVSVAECLASFQ